MIDAADKAWSSSQKAFYTISTKPEWVGIRGSCSDTTNAPVWLECWSDSRQRKYYQHRLTGHCVWKQNHGGSVRRDGSMGVGAVVEDAPVIAVARERLRNTYVCGHNYLITLPDFGTE